MRLRGIGYWGSARDTGSTLPDPRDYIDDSWDRDERRTVADYLENARRARFYMGFSRCRLCGCANGNAERLDDRYIWPEGLVHYVRDHAVRLPAEFVAHAVARAEQADAIESDLTWWRAEPACGSGRTWTVGMLELRADHDALGLTLATLSTSLDPERYRVAREELRDMGVCRITYASTRDAEAIRDELRTLGVVGSVSEERRRAPDELLG